MRHVPPVLPEGAPVAPGYEVIALLSRGRALDVYDVWSAERDCRCVAKVVRPDLRSDRSARSRLRREGRLLLRLSHPHVVRAYELIERPETVLVLETLGGATLAYVVETERRLAVADLAVLGLQLCSALRYLHRHGFLHLDLKPSNIVCEHGRAKLIDLSIARVPGRARKRQGTRVYMAPEQARGGRLSEATDVWGVGAVLYEAATGRRPFAGSEARHPQLERRAEPVRAQRRLPRALAESIDACLEPDPGRRPSLEELGPALSELA